MFYKYWISSVATYLFVSYVQCEIKALLFCLGFFLAGIFSISNLFVLNLKLNFWQLPGENINCFLLTEKPTNSVLLNSNQNALGRV